MDQARAVSRHGRGARDVSVSISGRILGTICRDRPYLFEPATWPLISALGKLSPKALYLDMDFEPGDMQFLKSEDASFPLCRRPIPSARRLPHDHREAGLPGVAREV